MALTLRQKFAAEKLGSDGDPVIQAALLLAFYEKGDAGANIKDPAFQARVRTLCEMTDEQFDKEHQRLVFEMRTEP